MITIMIVALVLCAYFYPSCPKILKDNKQMLLGVLMGLLMGQYLGLKVEGIEDGPPASSSPVEGQCSSPSSPPEGLTPCDIYSNSFCHILSDEKYDKEVKADVPFCYRAQCYKYYPDLQKIPGDNDIDSKVWWINEWGCGFDKWNKNNLNNLNT